MLGFQGFSSRLVPVNNWKSQAKIFKAAVYR